MNKTFEIPYYHDYISPELFPHLMSEAKDVEGVKDLVQLGKSGGLENKESLQFLCELYEKVKPELIKVLDQRIADRKFIDERVASCVTYNRELKIDFESADYQTIIGLEDGEGRIVIGPKSANFAKKDSAKKPIAPLPDYLKGPHVTLFGPPDNAKLSINAMNAYHRKLKGEPAIVEELLATHESVPKWGADDEDSKTPLREDLISAGENLTHCFDGTLSVPGYTLASEKRSLPIKRFPGLALPSLFLFYKNNPLPLHLYDFALHLFANWKNEKSLCFYVPKLENEEEAKYIHLMIKTAEEMIQKRNPDYKLGSVRLMIVLENPRAILRAHEMIDELYPYFAGASLGWHDYLGSTARLFKEDPHYRIPVKADPNIVIKYIKGSHNLLASVVGSRGGIKVGGMYGILPITPDLFSDSFQVTMKGYFKDVITQMKRDLTGFWVAHPDFVRIGLALLEAWKFHQKGDDSKLKALVEGLLDKKHHKEILDFIFGPDVEGLDVDDPLYVRSLLVADIKESTFIANNHPDEIRYNVFQSLQYLTDWLSGNGCVALPAQIAGTPVRVMDDLATAERSRWEVWHELNHGRFSLTEFLKIAHEELHFIRKDLSNDKKIVQVKWDERTSKWYPIAMKLMIKLMTEKNPVEFATEYLLPFTVDSVRESQDPWEKVQSIDPVKFKIDSQVERFNYYFEMCGCYDFALSQKDNLIVNEESIRQNILSFSKKQIIEAASFHGNIGESKKSLDPMATSEQSLVFNAEEQIKKELHSLGAEYLNKFGVKFLISAKGKTGSELLDHLKKRMNNSEAEELKNAREALLEITLKRMSEHPLNLLHDKIQKALALHKIKGAQIAVCSPGLQSLAFGEANNEMYFEYASLSKTVASAFAIDLLQKHGISTEDYVNEILQKSGDSFRLKTLGNGDPAWAEKVQVKHLMNHQALNMHYVKGYPANGDMPKIASLLHDVGVINEPGTKFQYSGGGFIVLEHLLEVLTKKKITEITRDFTKGFTFDPTTLPNTQYAKGYDVHGNLIEGTRLMFPSFAAGAMGPAKNMAVFLQEFAQKFKAGDDVVRQMMLSTDNGCKKFMGCEMGLGVFVAYAGENKVIIHQGANDGFRAIFLFCVEGPDYGKGVVVQSSGELNAVLFISEVVQLLLKELQFEGIDFSRFRGDFKTENLSQEEVVNIGYKNLIFDAFLPNLPEKIIVVGPKDKMADKNLAVEGIIGDVSNQRFARAENLLSPFVPVFDPKLYGKQGKIMDSWETVRHNQKECDTMIFELKKPSKIAALSLSTKYHLGNQAQAARVEGFADGGWHDILPKTELKGHAYFYKASQTPDKIFTLIRVSNYPDGGISRLGLYADYDKDLEKSFVYDESIPHPKKPLSIPFKASSETIQKNWNRFKKGHEVNFASAALGATVVRASNEHYGPAIQVISPFAPLSMFDGMESARSRKKDHSEEVVVALAKPAKIHRLELDFTYFVNNNPLYVSIYGLSKGEWKTLINRNNVKAFAGSTKEYKLNENNTFEQIRVVTHPDGGMNRLKAYGYVE